METNQATNKLTENDIGLIKILVKQRLSNLNDKLNAALILQNSLSVELLITNIEAEIRAYKNLLKKIN